MEPFKYGTRVNTYSYLHHWFSYSNTKHQRFINYNIYQIKITQISQFIRSFSSINQNSKILLLQEEQESNDKICNKHIQETFSIMCPFMFKHPTNVISWYLEYGDFNITIWIHPIKCVQLRWRLCWEIFSEYCLPINVSVCPVGGSRELQGHECTHNLSPHGKFKCNKGVTLDDDLH